MLEWYRDLMALLLDLLLRYREEVPSLRERLRDFALTLTVLVTLVAFGVLIVVCPELP